MTSKQGFYCKTCDAYHASRNTVKAHAKKAYAKPIDTEIDSVKNVSIDTSKSVNDTSIDSVKSVNLKEVYGEMAEEINQKPEKKVEQENNYTCNACGHQFYSGKRPKFCPMCGASE